jgi:SAM-dependent methyltransferase
MSHKRQPKQFTSAKGWDPVADWYDEWVGKCGSNHHRQLAIPTTLDLLDPRPDETVLDVGAGQGVLAPYIAGCGARYTGVDISHRLLKRARQHHANAGQFIQADARALWKARLLTPGIFDAVVFLLSIQDMNPLEPVLESANWTLKPGGRIVMLMTHPCFRIPRQSGWGHDAKRKLQYRRVDSYLSPLTVPMKTYPGQDGGATISFHRPLCEYINGLATRGLLIDRLDEITARREQADNRAQRRAEQEIPLFLALRARKLADT